MSVIAYPQSVVACPQRVAALDWAQIGSDLDAHGCAVVPGLLSPEECAALAASYAAPELFRSRVVMERHGYGRGEYQYFAYPLPEPVADLRAAPREWRARHLPSQHAARRVAPALRLAPHAGHHLP